MGGRGGVPGVARQPGARRGRRAAPAADRRRGCVRTTLRGGSMTFRVAMDIGGTFTDFGVIDEGGQVTVTGKTSTTPESPEQGVLEGLGQVVPDLADISF